MVEFNVAEARLETDRTTFISYSTFKGNTGYNNTRGLLMFGQQTFQVKYSEFKDLRNGLSGVLFYGGKKLSNVTKNDFIHCTEGIVTVGAGFNIIDNSFLDNFEAIINYDNIFNSLIKDNTITATGPLGTIDRTYQSPIQSAQNYGIMILGGTNSVVEINHNTINNIGNPILLGNTEAKLKCNDLQNNMLALYGGTNSKINMSNTLGGGNNMASNCEQFAEFDEAFNFEAHDGYNAFDISDQASCHTILKQPEKILVTTCPIITSGSLIDLTSQRADDLRHARAEHRDHHDQYDQVGKTHPGRNRRMLFS